MKSTHVVAYALSDQPLSVEFICPKRSSVKRILKNFNTLRPTILCVSLSKQKGSRWFIPLKVLLPSDQSLKLNSTPNFAIGQREGGNDKTQTLCYFSKSKIDQIIFRDKKCINSMYKKSLNESKRKLHRQSLFFSYQIVIKTNRTC